MATANIIALVGTALTLAASGFWAWFCLNR